MLLAISILGALYQRRDTGEGQRIQVAMQDAMLQHTVGLLHTSSDRQSGWASRCGRHFIGYAPMGLYPANHMGPTTTCTSTVIVPTPDSGTGFEVVGKTELIGDERLRLQPGVLKTESLSMNS